MPEFTGEVRVHTNARFAIIASRWNPSIVDALIDGARRSLAANGVDGSAVDLVRVPGAWELPMIAAKLALADRYAAILALGCVVRGQTRHYEHVADGRARGPTLVPLASRFPALHAVLPPQPHDDAQARRGRAP